jgi:hypothetical protein
MIDWTIIGNRNPATTTSNYDLSCINKCSQANFFVNINWFWYGPVYHGVDAVIDKDFAAAKMAELIEADVFVVLTAVEPQAITICPASTSVRKLTFS